VSERVEPRSAGDALGAYPAAAAEAFHEARVTRLRSATGWLSLVGKAFLQRGTFTLGASPAADVRLPDGAPELVGHLHVDGANVVRFEAAEGVDVRLAGQRVTSRVLVSDREGKADALTVGGFVLELMERGVALALRIRDVRRLPRPFAGIARYPYDPAWRKTARFVPHGEVRSVDLDLDGDGGAGASLSFASPGVVVFDAEGSEHRLEALLERGTAERLLLVFRDETTGSETHGLGRFVYASLPDEQGRLVVDFNLAGLPACAFTVFASCPIPPRENRLRVAVRAGERAYEAPPVGASCEERHCA
jgi:uncharacterized protein (DUF1684 family)